MALATPQLPAQVRASALLHGSDADFITNAYLALQRQWPDEGGFAHYLHVLHQSGARRAQLLREIASSPNARACGVEFIDDLPPDHHYHPEDHDSFRLLATTLALRVSRTAADVEQLRQSVGRLTGEELAGAVRALVLAQQAQQALLESRLHALEAEHRDDHPATAPADHLATSPAAAASEPGPAAWRHLATRQLSLAQEVGELRAAVAGLRDELAHARQALATLQQYTTVDLKREVARYVNALSTVQAMAPAPTARRAAALTPTPPALRGMAPRPAPRAGHASPGRAGPRNDAAIPLPRKAKPHRD